MPKKLRLIMVLVLMSFLTMGSAIAKEEPVPLRGVVEGFYGKPWSHADRMEILKFCGEQGFNAYIYAPKDDPYGKKRWREIYPRREWEELAQEVKTARENGVEFIYALSPGENLAYEGAAGAKERQLMMAKLEQLYQGGIRRFALFFDDLLGMTEKSAVTAEDGRNQAEFINRVQREFRALHPDVGAFLTVPTEYFKEDMFKGSKVKPYTATFAAALSPEVTVLYTGAGVVPEGIDDKELADMDKIFGRIPGIWWNYPVNDYMEGKLPLGPVVNLPRRADYPALFFNPMGRPEMTKITLATGAEYAKNPSSYDAVATWRRAIKEQYGALAEDMELFAAHSQRMENSWAHTGLPDGASLRRDMDEFWLTLGENKAAADSKRKNLQRQFRRLIAAAANLQKNLPPKVLAECRPQLELFGELAQADLEALELFAPAADSSEEKDDLQNRLKAKAQKFDAQEARVSEKTLRAFLDEALRFADNGHL